MAQASSAPNDSALSAIQVACLLGVNRNTVYALVKDGLLGSYHVGRKLRFTLADVEAYIKSTHVDAKSKKAVRAKTAVAKQESSFVLAGTDLILDILANYLASAGVAVRRDYSNSYHALVHLYAGQTAAAGIHLWDAHERRYNIPYVERLVPGVSCVVLRLIRRKTGLLVCKDNPKAIRRISHLIQNKVIFANRERGAGARVLLDEHLHNLEAASRQINGYAREISSELVTANMVSQGLADACIGTERSRAHVPGLEFLPIQEEEYDLVVVKTPQTTHIINGIKSILKSKGFRSEFTSSVGLDISRMGAVSYEC